MGIRDNVVSLTITEPGEYVFARNANFPDNIVLEINSAGVTVDGRGVTFAGIAGKSDLDLKNINLYFDEKKNMPGLPITECRDIKDSSIVTAGTSTMNIRGFGIGKLYGNIDTTKITVTCYPLIPIAGQGAGLPAGPCAASAINEVYGTVSGGTFTVKGDIVFGVLLNHGRVSGGKFTIKGTNEATGVGLNYGIVSGGKFTVDANRAFGVFENHDGTISGGTFIANGKKLKDPFERR